MRTLTVRRGLPHRYGFGGVRMQTQREQDHRRKFRRGTSLLMAVILAVTLLTPASPAGAQSSDPIEFPTLTLGSEGPLVRAWQMLLYHRGYYGHSVNGHFDSATLISTDQWQIATFGATTAKVNPASWQAMVPTVGPWEYSWAVYALKQLLSKNIKFSWGGDFTWYPQGQPNPGNDSWQFYWDEWNAIYNSQVHRGVTPTGTAALEDWRYLAWHYEVESLNRSRAGASVVCSANAPYPFGNSAPIALIDHVAYDYYDLAAYFNGVGGVWGRVTMTDFNTEHGTPTPGHSSHIYGMAIDVRPMHNSWDWPWGCMPSNTYYSGSYDQFRSRVYLTHSWNVAAEQYGLIYTQQLQLVYFNDPVLINEGLSTYWAGHDNHYHLHYCTYADPGHPTRCSWSF